MAISLSISATQNSQSVASNSSEITVIVNYSWTYGSYNHNGAWLEITANGKSNGGSTVKLNPSKTTSGSGELGRFTLEVPHNSDGTKTVYFSAYCDTGISSGTVETSGSKKLTQIPRKATISSAENFNDEGNPKITYNNPAGSSATKLEACISLTGAADDIAYRSISKTSTSYTFSLTTAERNVLRNSIPDAKSRKVRFYVRTTLGDNVYLSYLEKTFSIVNGNPTFSPTIEDTDSTTIALTGDSSKLVKYYSNAKITTGASAIKGATLKSQKVVCGAKSITTASGTINNIETNKFVFTATDSRGNSGTKTVNASMVNYVKLTCNFGKSTPDTSGNFNLTITGNYFNGSFGAVSNTLTVKYRYKVSGGTFSSWKTLTAQKSGNKYTATDSLTGLDYQTVYIFQAQAADKLATITTKETEIKSLPIFDWDADSFAFHVPLFFDNTKQLWWKDTNNNDVLMVSMNGSNQAFFGYGGYNAGLGSTYFDGNAVNIRSKNNISMTASGTIGGNKAWTNSSDSRLKTAIEDIPEVYIDIWLELEPKIFEWNDLNNPDGKKQFGLIAQDVIDVCNKYGVAYETLGFVSTIEINGVEYLALTYEHYHMITAQVLKNTVSQINLLKEELEELKAMLQGVN